MAQLQKQFIGLAASVAIFFSAAIGWAGIDPSTVQKLVAGNGRTFGSSISVDGNTVVIGASGDDTNGFSSGSAYVFVRNGIEGWSQQAKLLPDDGAADDSFGLFVSVSGDTAVIGAYLDDGSAYVFVRNGSGVWTQQAKLLPNDGVAKDYFGESVSVSGDTAVISADHDADNGTDSGSAYVFVRNGSGVWIQQAKLLPNDGAAYGYFGDSVSILGDTAVIGAISISSGSAYVFVRNGSGVWTQQAKLLPNDGAAGNFFGYSVSVSGDTVVIGNHNDDDNGAYSGSAYVFVRNGSGIWTQQAKLLPDDGAAADDLFGSSVSVSGEIIVISAHQDDNGDSSGSAYVFVRNRSGIWTQQTKLLPDDEGGFGVPVSVSGNTIMIGASQAVYVYGATRSAGALPAILSLLSGRKTISSTLNDNVISVDENSATDIVTSTIGTTGETELRLSGEISSSVQNGSILYMLPGSDGRFPFGIAGRVANTTSNTDGTKTIELQAVSYADVVQKASLDVQDITLDASNFVGVIAPSAIQAASPMPMAAMSDIPAEDFYSFRNGAIIVRNDKQESLQYSLAEAASTIDAGTVSLNMKVDLVDMDVDAKRMLPVDASTSIGFVINGSLKNIKLTNKLNFSKFPPAVNSADLRIDGDFNFDVKFNGKGDVTLGYFSRAWNEVKEESFRKLGVNAKLSGLSSDNKIGKFPLAGLVWSVKCPNTCPVLTGTTQTPLRQAKVMGVIVWVYLTLKGDIYDINGELALARLNPARLSLGIKKSAGGDFQLINSLERISSSGRLIEAPALNGTLKASLTAGVTTDLDFFTAGVRVANAGLDVIARTGTELTGNLSYGTDSLNSPWSWKGEACFTNNIGAGAVARASAHLGIDIDTSWVDAGGDFDYKFQLPTDKEMDMPGLHGGWYNVVGEEICTVSTVTAATGRVWMNKNLGASRAATSMNDTQAYGDLYQWGRLTDGHEKRTSSNTETFSSTDVPGHGNFILFGSVPTGDPHHPFSIYFDWRYPQNDNLWQGVDGKNNPCPDGFRLPTAAEWEEETATWDTLDAAGAFASPLKLVGAGMRSDLSGGISTFGGHYWSSTPENSDASELFFGPVVQPIVLVNVRARGYSVRCIRN